MVCVGGLGLGGCHGSIGLIHHPIHMRRQLHGGAARWGGAGGQPQGIFGGRTGPGAGAAVFPAHGFVVGGLWVFVCVLGWVLGGVSVHGLGVSGSGCGVLVDGWVDGWLMFLLACRLYLLIYPHGHHRWWAGWARRRWTTSRMSFPSSSSSVGRGMPLLLCFWRLCRHAWGVVVVVVCIWTDGRTHGGLRLTRAALGTFSSHPPYHRRFLLPNLYHQTQGAGRRARRGWC